MANEDTDCTHQTWMSFCFFNSYILNLDVNVILFFELVYIKSNPILEIESFLSLDQFWFESSKVVLLLTRLINSVWHTNLKQYIINAIISPQAFIYHQRRVSKKACTKTIYNKLKATQRRQHYSISANILILMLLLTPLGWKKHTNVILSRMQIYI